MKKVKTRKSSTKEVPKEPPKEVTKKAKVSKTEVLEEEVYTAPVEEKKTTPYMSDYEYTALIRSRALQLGTPDAEPKISLNPENPEEYDPINIATEEIRRCLTTLIIRRTLTDGTTEDWHPRDMVFPRI